MKYRKLSCEEKLISEIGMGSSVMAYQKEKDMIDTVTHAVENGVNYFDMAGGRSTVFPAYGKVLSQCRKDVMLQVHFGACYFSGEYGWSTELEDIKRSVAWQLEKMKTDYIDFGFIHCIDEESDLSNYERSGALQYLLELKEQGVVRHIGLSTHTPELANMVLDRGIIDMLMFSINPMYDYAQGSSGVKERFDLYCRCEKEGVGISVMKALNGGKLLDAKKSPFKQALTVNQCLRYALDKPGVLTVLSTPENLTQMKEILAYTTASDAECDYSIIGNFRIDSPVGKCVYCKHCQPCPVGLEIGLINKYYDLALIGDLLAKEHYLTLEKTACDCTGCGHCDSRCPFGVDQSNRMQEIKDFFGK